MPVFQKDERAYAARIEPRDWFEEGSQGRHAAERVVDEVCAVTLVELRAGVDASGVGEAQLRKALLAMGFEVQIL